MTASDDSTHETGAGDDAFLGMEIGGVELQRRIGQGGMGLVYEGWQDPPGRTVAVKLLRDALASDDAKVRFRHEARVLAGLQHPGIAQIYSAGTHHAPAEIPYFLMEYVAEALPITAYVKKHELPLDETLALAVHVCEAVQAGHARGIIHRDLKPANVLVDADGKPKVIDFGIARATEPSSDETPKTETGQLVGTIPYMSPEQSLGRSSAIDTRSDVYALGVILYETLTGRLPYDTEGLGVMEVIGAIQHRAPDPPASLREDLAGDVSIILGKALAKDPDVRYASAQALGQDLQRYLDRLPILARPPSVLYQLRLFARRHKAAALAIVGAGVAIVGALVAISLFAARESAARARAERERERGHELLHVSTAFIPVVADHLNNKLGALVGTTRVRMLLAKELEVLVSNIRAIEGASDDPHVAHAIGEVETALYNVKGGVGQNNLGEQAAALAHLERALTHYAQAVDAAPSDPTFVQALVSATLSKGAMFSTRGEPSKGLAVFDDVQALLDEAASVLPDAGFVEVARIDLATARGNALAGAGRFAAAIAEHERALAWTERLDVSGAQPGIREAMLVSTRINLAPLYARTGKREDAARNFDALLPLEKALEGKSSAIARNALWHIHEKLGRWAQTNGDDATAKHRFQQALDVAAQRVDADGSDHSARVQLRGSWMSMGAQREREGAHEEAAKYFERSLGALREEVAAAPGNATLQWDLRVVLTRLGIVHARAGNFEAARTHLDEARRLQTARHEADPGDLQELTGLAEVDHTDAQFYLVRGLSQEESSKAVTDLDQAIARFEEGIRRLEAARDAGSEDQDFEDNIAAWRKHADWARSLRAERTPTPGRGR